MATVSAEMTETQLYAAPARGEWSANEVLAHLRSCADMRGGCIQAILFEDVHTLRAVNTPHLDQTNGLSQTEFSALAASLSGAAQRTVCHIAAAAA